MKPSVTFSRSITLTPTHACANRCAYCSFHEEGDSLLSFDSARAVIERGLSAGCREALVMSGERPWETPRFPLTEEGYIDFVYELCLLALQAGLLPHTNIGVLAAKHLRRLREVNASMGLMLETSVVDLPAHRGGKDVRNRIAHLEEAGRLHIPFTTGILIGIGETREDRQEALGIIRDIHNRFGHIQEVIIQNFRGHPCTPMAGWPEPSREEMAWTVREARWMLGDTPIQVPPNLNSSLIELLQAGARDLGGVSLEPDRINPEQPWPAVAELETQVASVGLVLSERLPVHPEVDAELAPVADTLRRELVGDVVTYVVNRNINFTNICSGSCRFCAFRRGPNSRGAFLDTTGQILDKAREAVEIGATELCIQGGLHPDLTIHYYLDVLSTVKAAYPDLHIHAFSPMEVLTQVRQSGKSLEYVLAALKDAGLDSMPGTAAEILDDEVRRIICPEKLSTDEWADVVTTAHRMDIRTTATMMFGHIETWQQRVRHLEVLRRIQQETGGFTELVLLPFMPGRTALARRHGITAPSLEEVLKITAYCRLYLGRDIPNIQTSWVKIGIEGAKRSLSCGANDFGGTLMEENISRCAGAGHGQFLSPQDIEAAIREAGREPQQRDTLYRPVNRESHVGAK